MTYELTVETPDAGFLEEQVEAFEKAGLPRPDRQEDYSNGWAWDFTDKQKALDAFHQAAGVTVWQELVVNLHSDEDDETGALGSEKLVPLTREDVEGCCTMQQLAL